MGLRNQSKFTPLTVLFAMEFFHVWCRKYTIENAPTQPSYQCGRSSFQFRGKKSDLIHRMSWWARTGLRCLLEWGAMQWISSSNNKDSPIDRHFRKKRSQTNISIDRKKERTVKKRVRCGIKVTDWKMRCKKLQKQETDMREKKKLRCWKNDTWKNEVKRNWRTEK